MIKDTLLSFPRLLSMAKSQVESANYFDGRVCGRVQTVSMIDHVIKHMVPFSQLGFLLYKYHNGSYACSRVCIQSIVFIPYYLN